MKFESSLKPYLEGKKFSNGISFRIASASQNIDRLSYIEDFCRDKKVIHLGFADHLPLISEKILNNNWLHSRIINVASKCIGIDVDKDAIEYIQKHYSYPDLYLHNIITDAVLPAITNDQWDVMVLGEIVEHLDNPVAFLAELHKKYGKNIKQLIVTVPNALDFTNIRMAKNHKEAINSDHRFWFTPYTLARVAVAGGWQPDNFDFCQTFLPHKWYYRWIVNKYPAFRETLVMVLNS